MKLFRLEWTKVRQLRELISARHTLQSKRVALINSIRFHDLRHTYASIQIDLGANPKYLQKQMGRSSIKITLDIYGHLIKDVNKGAASRLGEAIFGENSSNMVATNDKRISHYS